MIRAATELRERVEAVDFIFRLSRPDLPRQARRTQAWRYSIPSGPDHGVLSIDVDQSTLPKIRPGVAESPIYVSIDRGRFVGAVVCSCVVPGLPLRIMAHAVHPEYQGRGYGGALVRHVMALHAIVGMAVDVERQDRRDYATHLGIVH